MCVLAVPTALALVSVSVSATPVLAASHSVRVRRQRDTLSRSSSLLVPFPSVGFFSILFYLSVASFVHFILQFSSVFF